MSLTVGTGPFGHRPGGTFNREMPEAKGTAKRLWAQTGLKPSDMQAAMIYDAFTPHVLLQLEGFGFCKPGEAAGFEKSGGIALDGQLPVNTHGGLLGEA